MPELPEVETVARWLRESVQGRRIERAEVSYPRLIRDPAPRAFCRRLQGASIAEVGRRGKYLLLGLSHGQTLLVHLRMTGRFFYVEAGREVTKHTAAVFYFDNRHKLAFDDQRHFGVMRLVSTARLGESEELGPLAPEPFGPDFSADYLYEVLRRTARPVKEALLDQTKVLGLGNIYAAEALWRAGVNPLRRARELTRPRVARLHEAIVAVLRAAVEAGRGPMKLSSVSTAARARAACAAAPWCGAWCKATARLFTARAASAARTPGARAQACARKERQVDCTAARTPGRRRRPNRGR
jgi:formamidopyrimidine-DNA glycosylase